MKKLSLFALAAAGMLLGACSSDDDVAVKNVACEDFKDGAFIGLSLQLPTADPTTRANDDLSNGTEDEFDVKNATLYIFKAASSETNPDEKAKFVAKVSLGNNYDPDKEGGIDPDEWGVQEGVDDTKITSTYTQATLIPNDLASQIKADIANKYYAYVIINHNGQVTAPTEDVTTFKDFSNQQFNQIGADIAAEKNVWETGLLMTNAPICDKSGGIAAPDEAKYSTLVWLDNQKIFGSKAEAEAAPAACVYVERAAVKITVVDNRTTDGKKLGGLDVTINGWQVLNNEPTYYNTRHINNDGANAEDWGSYYNASWTDKNTTYRFVSLYKYEPTLPAGATHTTGYRTYFAQDVQYNKDATLANTVASEDRPWIAVDKHAYTTENTFDVAHQTWQNTTSVTLKVTIGDGTQGFYTVGKGGETMYIDDADMTALGARSGLEKALVQIENVVKADNDVAQALADLRVKISQNNTFKPVASGLTLSLTGAAPTTGTTNVEYKVDLDYQLDGAPYTTFAGTDEAALKDALVDAINTFLINQADAVLLSYYAGGVSYYNVRIKHFGDIETPWSSSGTYIYGGGVGVNEIYFGIENGKTPDAAQLAAAQNNFLGRYGVVRDNWYKLSIDKIGKIGDPVPTDPTTTTPDTPDDEVDNYISVHVHIVPWVLREQSVQF